MTYEVQKVDLNCGKVLMQSDRYWWLQVLMIGCLLGPNRIKGQSTEIPSRQAVGSVDVLGDPLPEHARMRFGTVRFQHPSPVVEMALSPDDATVITASQRDLIAWDTATGKMRWRGDIDGDGFRLPGAAYGIRAIAFSRSNEHFYSVGLVGGVLKRNLRTGAAQELLAAHNLPILSSNRPLNGPPGSIRSIDVTSDDSKLALAGAHGVVVCDATGEVLLEIPNNPVGEVLLAEMNKDRLMFGGHYSLAVFSPNGEQLAVVTSEFPKKIRLFDVASGKVERDWELKDRLVRMAFSPDGNSLATTERDSSIRRYSLKDGQQIWEHVIRLKDDAESYTSGLSFSPDGSRVAACAPIGNDHWIYILDSSNGSVLAILKGHAWKPWQVAFSSDGELLYSSGWDGAIRRWNMRTFEQLGPPQGIRCSEVIAAAPTGQRVAYADDLGNVHVVNSVVNEEQFVIPGIKIRFSQLAFSADENLLAGGGTNETEVCAVVWDGTTGAVKHEFKWPKGKDPHSTVESLDFSSDGRHLAVAVFRQNQALVWDLTKGEQVAAPKHPQIYGLAFDPLSNQLATVGWDKVVRLWSRDLGTLISEHDLSATLKDANDLRMYGVKYSPRGDSLATAHMDGTVRVWNRDMTLQSRLVIGGSFVYGAIAYSPDGSWLATGAASGAVTVWDPISGNPMWSDGKHQNYVYTVGFLENGRALVSGGSDGVGYCWDLLPKSGVENTDLAQLWRDLGSNDAQAYRAMWHLIQLGDPSVTFIDERISQVKTLLNPDAVIQGLDGDEAERRRRLSLQLIEKDRRVESDVRIHQALALLVRMNRESSTTLLKRISESHAVEKIRREAASELQNSQLTSASR